MNIVSLKIKNFMSIKDAELKLGQINQINGLNSQGKTTILKAIETAAKGSTDGKLVTFGEEAAEIIVELPDETTIRRRISSEGKQTVNIKRGEFSAPKPQEFLEGLFEMSAFNPLDLLDPKKRSESIMKSIDLKVSAQTLAEKLGVEDVTLPPVNYSKHGLEVIDEVYKYYYQRRAEANKDTATKKNKWQVNKDGFAPVEAPKAGRAEIDNVKYALEQKKSDVRGQLQLARTLHESNDKVKKTVQLYTDGLAKIQSEIDEVEEVYQAALKKLAQEKELSLAKLTTRIAEGKKYLAAAQEEVKEAVPATEPFVAEIDKIDKELEALKLDDEKLRTYEATAKTQAMIADLETEFKDAEKFGAHLTSQLEKFTQIKEDLMAAVEMPIKGLTFKDGGFYVNDTPIDNLSSSMALKLAVAVARKLAKKTKIICIDGAEMLDEVTYSEFIKEIKDDGFTYFITKVGFGGVGSPDVNVITMSKGQVQ